MAYLQGHPTLPDGSRHSREPSRIGAKGTRKIAHARLLEARLMAKSATPMGEMVFHVAGAFAQFERRLIQERVKAGLERARSQGKRLGRPTVVDRSVRSAVHRGHAVGVSNRAIGRRLRVSEATVRRVLMAHPKS